MADPKQGQKPTLQPERSPLPLPPPPPAGLPAHGALRMRDITDGM